MKRTQGGMTLVGFIIVLAVVGVFVYTGMKVIPMYTEFYSVKKALNSFDNEAGAANYDAGKIRELLSRKFDIGYIDSINAKDVKITRKDSNLQLNADYEVRRPLIYNLDIVGKFSAEKTIKRDGTE